MATFGSDSKGAYAIVEPGDTLSEICDEYFKLGSYSEIEAKCNAVAKLNSIPNTHLIYVDQKIYLTGKASSSSSSSATKNKCEINYFGLLSTSEQPTLYVGWLWWKPEDQVEHFEYEWEYTRVDTPSSKWWTISGGKGTTDEWESTAVIPDDALQVRFRVRAVSKTWEDTVGDGDNKKTVTKTHWSCDWTDFKKDGAYYQYDVQKYVPPKAPAAPSVSLKEPDKNVLVAELNDVDHVNLDATVIEFQIVKNNTSQFGKIATANIDLSYHYVKHESGKLDPGAKYKVRCRSVRGSLRSEWSPYSSEVATAPSKPAGFTDCRAKSSFTDGKISVYLAWKAVSAAKTYDIEYATNIDYFDGTDQTTVVNGIELTHYETYSLAIGTQYYFRLRAVNDGGESDWSAISDPIVLGEPPDAPTTWSSVTTATVGDPLNLYWVHNATDGSSETWAQVALEIYTANGLDENGNINYKLEWSKETEIPNSNHFEDKDKTNSFDVSEYLQINIPSLYKDGVQLRWRVRTAGVTNELGDWSVVRMIDIHSKPTVSLDVRDATNTINTTFDTIGSFPIYISATTQPATQAPIGFHLSIVSNSVYDTIDSIGQDKTVNAGDEVYSKFFDQDTDLEDVVISAGDVDLESSMDYTIKCVASMNSGLTAGADLDFSVHWEDVPYMPNASILYDSETVVTHIHPTCGMYTFTFYKVAHDILTDTYSATDEEISVIVNGGKPLSCPWTYDASGNKKRVYTETTDTGSTRYYYLSNGRKVNVSRYNVTSQREPVRLENGSIVWTGSTDIEIDEDGVVTGGETVYYYKGEKVVNAEGVLLSVYRREFDGSFTELAKDIDNLSNTYITDPHPALDSARYRIVATSVSTGAVSYYDMPGLKIGEKDIIIQWDEDWSNFEDVGDALPSQPPWSGSMLRLPYNIDISDSYGMDVSLVEYIGRKRPVSYYGTQLGETSTWNTVVPKDDEETIYALRRLATWTGDAYVREPSGTGYWANVSVSFSQKHNDLTIPVTLSIKRVEGGA